MTQDQNNSDGEPRVYLAGPIKEADDSGRGWRASISNADSLLTYIDPLDYVDGGDPTEVDVTDIELVEMDLELIASADAVLVNYCGEATWGTPMEVVYAARMYEMPIAIAWQSDARVSPWAQTHADFVEADVGACRAYLESQFYEDVDGPLTYGARVDMWSPAPLTDRLPETDNEM